MGAALGRFLRKPLPRTPTILDQNCGALAQLGERLICIQEVSGSIPLGSTKLLAQQGASTKQRFRAAKRELVKTGTDIKAATTLL